jgi:hypothetical protein
VAWSAPLTAVSNAALTAAQWNASVRDDLAETAPAKATTAGSHFAATGTNAIAQRTTIQDSIVTNQTTASTTYADLTTAGPLISTAHGVAAIVSIAAWMANDTSGARSLMSFRLSGANTVAAIDDSAAAFNPQTGSASIFVCCARTWLQTSLSPGTTQFRSVYRATAGNGSFQQRSLVVMPL